MSHFSRLKTQIVEKEYLLLALKDLGYKVEEGPLEIKSFGVERTKVDLRIPLRMSGDIGFRKVGENYEIVADWWGVRGVKRKEFADAVAQRYAYHATRAKLEQQGFTLVEEQTGEKGQIRMVLRRMV
ncbi:MAG TPA: DUF1257 domain-containing protein [Anaerolineaceae bacterium]